ncbi:TPA: UDP-N-acetylglucosamine 2-epimerase (non-hydrolyzing), partial [Candidatus Bipolaricaulota bacterium]|nr:UDP-N-acetylglucosamine 2-epimerase (non-hydrolyzing) [Candidatus Bipolaricaulota bacterium]
APALGKPVLVMRERTERPEGLATGAARLVGVDRERIFQEAQRLLDDPAEYAGMVHAAKEHPSLYGDGRAAERIVSILKERLSRPRLERRP